MIDLIRMTSEAEIGVFVEATLEQYSYDLRESLLLEPDVADRKSERDLGHLRSGNFDGDEHYFFHVRQSTTGASVGGLWFAIEKEIRTGWLHYILINRASRRMGFGRMAIDKLHRKAEELGCAQMFLNVYTHNPNAQALYRKLGYRQASSFMRRPLPIEARVTAADRVPAEGTATV